MAASRPFEIRTFVVGPLATNSYLVIANDRALAIDPGHGAAALLTAEADRLGATIETIVNTHGHWDHVADNAALLRLARVPLLIHAADAPMIEAAAPLSFGMDVPWEPSRPTAYLDESSEVPVGDTIFTVIHTPGHTPGGICLLSTDHAILIAGDTLFAGTHGRVDLPGSDPDLMTESLRRLAEFAPELTVYPGHGPATTIAVERGWLARL